MADGVAKQNAAKSKIASSTLTTSHLPRPFQCQWREGCSKSFNRKSDLQRHYRIHTNERPYACDYKPCQKTFIQRSALTVHRRTHTGDKPHRCPYNGCGKCFSDSSSLARHRRIHTNDKPYICKNQQCRKAFCRKTTMTKHFRKEHPAETMKEEDDVGGSDAEPSDDDASDQETEDSQEEPQNVYLKSESAPETQSMHRVGAYNANLWRLPGQMAQQPGPRQVQSPFDQHSEISNPSVKLERSMSRTPQKALTERYPSASAQPAGFPQHRANTLPSSIPANGPGGIAVQQYLVDDVDRLWHSAQAIQGSPTSLTNSSSGFDQPQVDYSSQTYQLLQTHQAATYPQLQDQHAIQHIMRDEPQQRQYNTISRPQNHQPLYNGMPQQAPLHHAIQPQQYNDSPQNTPPYHEDFSPTPAPTQSPPYPNALSDAPYQPPQFVSEVPLETYSVPNPYFPPPTGMYQFADPLDWWKENKSDDTWTQMPNQVLQGFGS